MRKRGEIWLADLNPPRGTGPGKTRPVLIVQAIDGQLRREYRYAVGGQIVAGLALILLSGGFVFLVMNGHERPAYALLGAGVLNVIGGFIRARLSDAGEPVTATFPVMVKVSFAGPSAVGENTTLTVQVAAGFKAAPQVPPAVPAGLE